MGVRGHYRAPRSVSITDERYGPMRDLSEKERVLGFRLAARGEVA